MFISLPSYFTHAWDVFVLFLIPIGGGIPAGVVLAQKQGIPWQAMEALYFVSDVILAIVFEPLMLYLARRSKEAPWGTKMREAWMKSLGRIIDQYGLTPGPLSLVFITFGTDPMTGRSVAFMAGHGFLTGWALTIMGDMMFFTVLMASTLWLNNFLGDGTWAAIIITVAVMIFPAIARALRRRWAFWRGTRAPSQPAK
jgi:hypothetical protein